MRRYIQNLIIILLLAIIAIWIDLPGNKGIHLLGIDKDIKTVLGLDLVGGVQALLEADVPDNQVVDAESMNTAVQIVENRVNGLGVSEAVVQKAGDRRILVEMPGADDPEQALAALKQTGLLEFVDMSDVAYEEIARLEETQEEIVTNFSTSSQTVTDTSKVFETIMTGAELIDARATTDTTGRYEVAFELNSEGSTIFKEFTSQHKNDVLAIVLDKRIISAPSIENTIPDGKGVIQGNFTYEQANTLAVQLRYGSLPIPLKVVESRTVSATLGEDSLKKSLVAGLIGFTIVILFMTIFYRIPGLIASVAILLYAIITYAIFRYIPVTLTLSGVAGFLLSTGSALDANILIFERIKEELRFGKSINQALEQGWKRAKSSIRDSNIATMITCIILFWFGSQFGATIVKGFAVTLFLGIIVSLFTAVFVTRTFLASVHQNYTPKNISAWFGL